MSIGICFSGGGIKGAAHIGVIKAFEEENIKFEYLSGTSSGSIVSVLYSIGYNSNEIKEIFEKNIKKIKYIEFKKIIDLIYGIIFKRKIIIDGLNSGKNIEKIINKYSEKKNIYNINEVKKKILIPSINIQTGEIYIFSSVKVPKNCREFSDNIKYIDNINVGKAVRASCSYPGVFSPCNYNNVKLIDGGVRENTPWKELKKIGVDKVICVIFSEEKEYIKQYENNIFNVIGSSIKILNHELSNYELYGNDYIIKIKSKNIGLLDYKRINYMYNIGYEEGKKFIKNNKGKLNDLFY